MRDARISYPFLRLPEGSITTGPWTVSTGSSEKRPLSNEIEGWDYNVDLTLRRTILIELDEASSYARLPPESGIKLFVTAGTGPESEKVQEIVHASTFTMEGERKQIDINFVIPGSWLSGRLYLRTEMVLARPSTDHQPLAATRYCSRLWSDEHMASLEGEMGRFPMEAHDFSTVHAGRGIDDAFWYLEWYPHDMEIQFLSGVRLHLNTRQNEFLERVQSKDPATLSQLMSSVAFEMVTAFVHVLDPVRGWDHFEDGAIGRVLRTWIEAALPGQSPNAVAQLLSRDPSRVQAALQSTMVV